MEHCETILTGPLDSVARGEESVECVEDVGGLLKSVDTSCSVESGLSLPFESVAAAILSCSSAILSARALSFASSHVLRLKIPLPPSPPSGTGTDRKVIANDRLRRGRLQKPEKHAPP